MKPDSAAKKPRTNWLAVWRKRLEYVRKGRTMSERKPVLCVVAGPNGSGKTSTTVRLLSNEWASDCIYINPDDIAQNDFGDWNSGDAILKAARKATEMRNDCLERKVDFVFETVFSLDSFSFVLTILPLIFNEYINVTLMVVMRFRCRK